jgi:hypothetical protein
MIGGRSIEAVVEVSHPDAGAPWPTLPGAETFYVRLHAGVTDEEVGSIMLTACLYNRVEVSRDAAETLSRFIAEDGFVLPGGPRLAAGGREVVPGCCCGLEDWHEWLEVPRGKNTVWTGHDPSPEVEYVGDRVRVWQDRKSEGVGFVEFDRGEMEALLARVGSDLEGFLHRLGGWAEHLAPSLGQRVAEYFAEHMNIAPGRT